MSTNGNSQPEAELTRERIAILLQDIPAENLAFIEQFVLFMSQKGQSVVIASQSEEKTLYLYPTVPVPASTLNNWSGLLDEGYEGDALADTEALYDDV